MSNEYLAVNVPCPDCGSSDALSVYSNNASFCFKCRRAHNELTDEQVEKLCVASQPSNKKRKGIKMPKSPEEFTYADKATYRNLVDRGISSKTCEVYGVKSLYDPRVEKYIHCYPYFNEEKNLTAQKVRDFRKNKKVKGHMKIDTIDGTEFGDTTLFGQQAFDLEKFKYVTICEGEADAMAAYELLGSKFPVLSVSCGAGAAKGELMKWSHLLAKVPNITLCFDMDEEGKKAALECQSLFFENTCRIMEIPRGVKDACDILEISKDDPTVIDEFRDAFFRAKEWRPKGIISGKEALIQMLEENQIECIPSPWTGLDELTGGFRTGELWTWTAGSGQGKSQVIREVMDWLYRETQWREGVMMMEENIKRTCLSLAGVHCSLPLHILTLKGTPEQTAKYKKIAAKVGAEMFGEGDRFEFKDHFGSSDINAIVKEVEFMARTKQCKVVFLDHLSMIVSSQENGDERKAIDECMTKLRTIVQGTNISLHLISHLKRPNGKGHEDGAITSISELRGSASIAQLSDMVISLERNQQAEDDFIRNTTRLRVLKNRFSGDTGPACYLHYSKDTGRMEEVADEIVEAALEASDENPINKFD